MAKGDEKRQAQQEHNQFVARQNRELAGATERRDQMYGSLYGGLNNLIQTGGISADDRSRVLSGLESGGGGGGGGGYYAPPAMNIMQRYDPVVQQYKKAMDGSSTDVNSLRKANPVFEDLMKTGGWDDAARTSANWRLGELDKIAQTGGLDNESVARMRGGGMFEEAMASGLIDQEGINRLRGNGYLDEFAQTGGLDENSRSMLRRRATSPISAGYDATRQEVERLGRVSGGGGPGRAALAARLARDQARESADASLNAELGITDRVLQGRMSGIQGLVEAEQGLQDRLAGNRKWGAEGMVSAEQGLQDLVSSNRLNALNTGLTQQRGILGEIAGVRAGSGKELSGVEQNIANMLQDERRYGTEGMREMIGQQIAEEQRAAAAAAAASAARANASRQSAQDLMRMVDWERDGRLAGLSGMGELYGTAPAELFGREGIGLEEQRNRLGSQQQGESGWSTALRTAGTAATIAAAFSDKRKKNNIQDVDEAISDRDAKIGIKASDPRVVLQQLKNLPLYTWSYKDDPKKVPHIGPMAQDIKKYFGVGDGQTIQLVDFMGIMFSAMKGLALVQEGARV